MLDDDEAARYWSKRSNDPGGGGNVQNGVFKDDPATRSTQRRGAPGRKPWVKPPPKPVHELEKTKGLEAKRHFLAIRVRDWRHGIFKMVVFSAIQTCLPS